MMKAKTFQRDKKKLNVVKSIFKTVNRWSIHYTRRKGIPVFKNPIGEEISPRSGIESFLLQLQVVTAQPSITV